MEILKELTKIDGVSGNEAEMAKWLEAFLLKHGCRTFINKAGSVTAVFGDIDKNKKTILLEAHMDKIGLVVCEIAEGGFVKFKALGGVDERTLPASEVYIQGKERIFGVIGAVPPHLKGVGAEGNSVKIQDLVIDTGFSKAELESKISVGDPIVLKSEFSILQDARISAAALDNRAGIRAVLRAVEMLSEKEKQYNIKLAFTVGEELGLLGARTIDCSDVDLAVVVDVTHGQTPDSKAEGTFPLGSGVVICRGPNLDYNVTKNVIEIAREKNIAHTIEVAGGNTGTNAWVIQTLEQGIRCVLLSIPLRYMHTVVETIDLDDIEAAARLIAASIEGGGLFA